MDFLLLSAARHTIYKSIKSFYVSIWGVHYHDFWCFSKYFVICFQQTVAKILPVVKWNIKSKLWSVFHHFLLPQFASIFFLQLKFKHWNIYIFKETIRILDFLLCYFVIETECFNFVFHLIKWISNIVVLTSNCRRLPQGSKKREMSQNLRASLF